MTRLQDARRASLKNIEAPFADSELFFSRTDPHGIILAGNTVFQRVSGYAWSELLQKPHKIIRHPDTPRAVFWLLWDTIRRGEPVAAYVKNRAQDGAYYWVLAVVTPVDGGYLSVRLKPGGPLFETVQQLYAERVEAEDAGGEEPAASAAALLKRLEDLGFASYAAFMAAAVSAELIGRDVRLGRAPDPTLRRLDPVVEAARSMVEVAAGIAGVYHDHAFMPLNFRIQSAQLGAGGAAISAISANYTDLAGELSRCVARFATSAELVHRAVLDGVFLSAVACLQREMSALFRDAPANEADAADDAAAGDIDAAAESTRLVQQQADFEDKAVEGLRAIAVQSEAFRVDCTEMTRLAAGLEVTRVMGQVESARLDSPAEALGKLLAELEAFQQTLSASLKVLDRQNTEILTLCGKLTAPGPADPGRAAQDVLASGPSPLPLPPLAGPSEPY